MLFSRNMIQIDVYINYGNDDVRHKRLIAEPRISALDALTEQQISSIHTADIALAVRDEHQDQGLGTELITYLTYLAKRKGLLGFTAEVLVGNDPVFRLFDRMGFDVHKRNESGIYEMKLLFKDIDQN